ncbi:MAG: hypothetical protein LBG27_02715 [Spirochaetaceae bacterium]|jgi:hypothetical protein|nr:hypothetical protein [Spirochaetaceae bacterium]
MMCRKNALRKFGGRRFQGAKGAFGFPRAAAAAAGYFPRPFIRQQREARAALAGADAGAAGCPCLTGSVKFHVLDQIVKHRQAAPAGRCPARGGKLFKEQPFFP